MHARTCILRGSTLIGGVNRLCLDYVYVRSKTETDKVFKFVLGVQLKVSSFLLILVSSGFNNAYGSGN